MSENQGFSFGGFSPGKMPPSAGTRTPEQIRAAAVDPLRGLLERAAADGGYVPQADIPDDDVVVRKSQRADSDLSSQHAKTQADVTHELDKTMPVTTNPSAMRTLRDAQAGVVGRQTPSSMIELLNQGQQAESRGLMSKFGGVWQGIRDVFTVDAADRAVNAELEAATVVVSSPVPAPIHTPSGDYVGSSMTLTAPEPKADLDAVVSSDGEKEVVVDPDLEDLERGQTWGQRLADSAVGRLVNIGVGTALEVGGRLDDRRDAKMMQQHEQAAAEEEIDDKPSKEDNKPTGDDMTELLNEASQEAGPRYTLNDPELEKGCVPYDAVDPSTFGLLANGRSLIPMQDPLPPVPEKIFTELDEVPVITEHPIQYLKMGKEGRTKLQEQIDEQAVKKSEYDAAVAEVEAANAAVEAHNYLANVHNQTVALDAEYLGTQQITHTSLQPDVREGVTSRINDGLPPQISMGVRQSLSAHGIVAATGNFREVATKVIEPTNGGVQDIELPGGHIHPAAEYVPNLVAYYVNQQLEAAVPRAVEAGYDATIVATGHEVTVDALAAIGMKPEFPLKGELLVDGWKLNRAAVYAHAVRNGVIQLEQGSNPGELVLVPGDQKELAELAKTILDDIGELDDEKITKLQTLAGTIIGTHFMTSELNMGLGESLDVDPMLPSAIERDSTFDLEMVVRNGGKDYLVGAHSVLKGSTGNIGLEEGQEVPLYWQANGVQLHRDATESVLDSMKGGGVFVNPLVRLGGGVAIGSQNVTVYDALKALQFQTNPTRVGIVGDPINADYVPASEKFSTTGQYAIGSNAAGEIEA